MNKNARKRRGVSLTNPKKIRRSDLMPNPKNERLNRSSSISDTLYRTSDYLLSSDINFNHRFSTLKQINDSYEKSDSDSPRDNGMSMSIQVFSEDVSGWFWFKIFELVIPLSMTKLIKLNRWEEVLNWGENRIGFTHRIRTVSFIKLTDVCFPTLITEILLELYSMTSV